jgi:hypothetical protein
MRSGMRFGLSSIEKRDVWSRWKAGQTLHEIGRAYGKPHNSISGDTFDDLGAVCLALNQDGNSAEPRVWHLHQDFVITLNLKRENDTWLAIDEDYVEVARLRREKDDPVLLEVRAEYLKDYLCARRMALYVTSYRSRTEVVLPDAALTWTENPLRVISDRERWEGRTSEIHEGGHAFGSSMMVMHLGRTRVDFLRGCS